MEDTPPGQEEAAESVVVALGGDANLLRPRLLLGRTARTGEEQAHRRPLPLLLVWGLHLISRRERASFEVAIFELPYINHGLPRKLLPTSATERQSSSPQKR